MSAPRAAKRGPNQQLSRTRSRAVVKTAISPGIRIESFRRRQRGNEVEEGETLCKMIVEGGACMEMAYRGRWEAEIAEMRRVLGAFAMKEECKWGKPTYTVGGKNVVIMQEELPVPLCRSQARRDTGGAHRKSDAGDFRRQRVPGETLDRRGCYCGGVCLTSAVNISTRSVPRRGICVRPWKPTREH